jgi:hypothetical protein
MFFAPKTDVAFPLNGIYDRLGTSFYDNQHYTWQQSIEMFKDSVRQGKKTFMFLHTYDVHEPFLIENNEQLYEPKNTKFPDTSAEFFGDFEITKEFADMVVQDAKIGVAANDIWQKNKDLAEIRLEELLAVEPDYNKELVVLQKMRKEGLLSDAYQLSQNYMRYIDTSNSIDIEMLEALYDQTINMLDQNKIPLLTELLDSPEFKDNTIAIIYSEHGEEFMEHGHLFHESMYNQNIKVPLIIHLPGIVNKKIHSNVQLVDIIPTLNELLDFDSDVNYDGRSLVKEIFNFNKSNELVISDGWNFEGKALIYKDWKLFLSKIDNGYVPYELYNLKDDPGETNNLLFERIDIKDKILEVYSKVLDSAHK